MLEESKKIRNRIGNKGNKLKVEEDRKQGTLTIRYARDQQEVLRVG